MYVAHFRLFCSVSMFFTSSLFFFLSFDFSLIFLVLLSMPLCPAINVAAPPRTPMVMGLGKIMVTATPPATTTNASSAFPNTLSLSFLMSFFMLLRVLLIASLSFRISSSDRFGYVIYYYNIKMLLTFGYVLAGMMLYDYFTDTKKKMISTGSGEDSEQTFLIKSGEGEMTLPPCELIAVELGPLKGVSKAILQIMDKECKPLTDVGKEKKYVKLTPTRYQTNVYLKMKKETEMPITAYYRV